ncbi:MAG: nicotinate (nicotinamide) nucleotide adenylyltransferase [Actinomycetia bacterium]|nr:nicotinate (nicotinamide) nucleotide adenylyltransferase [Actinomycetes bacterium]MCP4225871.1 nicotinate (nicotinamide) nucleotide adenylyltransferase [Actinomycetes bacterium]MCP5030587.1 nicotinate (nicotinamide) nucleotide adenylyltransferase [Actinomycetes bacterium]
MAKRVGLLGGTFDPPHLGHLIAADQVLDQLELDEVWLVVSNSPWQKTGARTITPAATRLELVEAAVVGAPGLVASGVELEIGGPSYTSVTLEVLEECYPETDWLIIVGADAAAGLDSWHRAEELRRQRRFVVVNRPGVAANTPEGWNCFPVEIPPIALSSTELRIMVEGGRSIRHLCPALVAQAIARLGLYGRRS